jgi:hypothetical protein
MAKSDRKAQLLQQPLQAKPTPPIVHTPVSPKPKRAGHLRGAGRLTEQARQDAGNATETIDARGKISMEYYDADGNVTAAVGRQRHAHHRSRWAHHADRLRRRTVPHSHDLSPHGPGGARHI